MNTPTDLETKDRAYLLSVVAEQQSQIKRVEALAARWSTQTDGRAYYAKRVRHALKTPAAMEAAS